MCMCLSKKTQQENAHAKFYNEVKEHMPTDISKLIEKYEKHPQLDTFLDNKKF